MTTPTTAYSAPTSSVKVSDFRTQQGEPSYLDITVLSGPSFGAVGAVFDGWCLDVRVALDSPANYVVSYFSSYETALLSGAMPTLGNPGGFISNLDSINWLMGYYNPTTAQTYTYGDVQAAIWTMMGQDWRLGQDAALGAVDQTRITTLVNLALAHDGYVPDAGEAIGIVLDPVNASGAHHQPIIIETQAAKLGDHVWSDNNANGLQDAGEPGIAGAPVQLGRDLNGDGVLGAGEVLASAVTDANGDYAFKGLTPGLKYQVQFGLPAGYTTASPRQADGNAASGVNSDGSISDVVVLKAGENNTTIDSGFYKTASLGDRVWTDSNANGLQDSGEAGVAGVTVNLCDASGVVVATKTTDGSGSYLFSGLKPGNYSVQFVAPANTQFTSKDAILPGNGLQDDSFVAPNIPVYLLDATGTTVLATTTTDANGHYGFDVVPGTYRIKALAGIGATLQNVGTNDAIDSDINAQGISDAVTVKSGEVNLTVDAGLITSFFSPVVLDLDGSGRIETTRLADSGGSFDLLGTGHAVQSGWVTGGDGFLAVDSNGNGRVDGIGELFGGNRMGVGFAKLAGFDSNGDGLVDQLDAKFGQLMIWRDANGNHQTDAGEMVSLAEAGVASLVLEHTNTLTLDAQGNGLGETSSATLANGSSVTMTDVYFAVSPDDAKAAAAGVPGVADVLSDDRALDAVLGQSAAAPVHLQPTDVPLDGLGEATELIRRITALTHDHEPFAAV